MSLGYLIALSVVYLLIGVAVVQAVTPQVLLTTPQKWITFLIWPFVVIVVWCFFVMYIINIFAELVYKLWQGLME